MAARPRMMFFVYIAVSVACGLLALIFLFGRPAIAVTFLAVSLLGLAPLFQSADGIPAHADGRLAGEPWRLLAVVVLPGDVFVVTLRFQPDDVRTYRLTLPDGQQRDQFLQAAAGLKKGKALMGRARRGRAGRLDDSEMGFDFVEVPQATKEGTP